MRRLVVALALLAWLAAGAAGHAAPAAPPAAAVARALANLAGEDAARREAVVALLGETRDPKWLAFLAAFRDGSVYAWTRRGTRELVVGGARATRGDQEVIAIAGAYDRTPLGEVPLAGLAEVAADRRLRLAIKPFLDADETRVQLADPDPAVRRGAAVKLGNQADAATAAVVEAALAREPDRWVRRALAEALALIRLAHGAPEARAAASPSAARPALGALVSRLLESLKPRPALKPPINSSELAAPISAKQRGQDDKGFSPN